MKLLKNIKLLKPLRIFMGAILALFALFLMAACSPQLGQASQEGRAVFIITDAAANMGEVTNIRVTIDSVQVLSESTGWIKVSAEEHTYDLLKLKSEGIQALLADYNLTPGVYRQMRLDISKVIVTDQLGNHTAKLPSGVLKIFGNLTVNANSTSTVKFDFIADKSLHITGNGQYIFAPVIQLETRQRAQVETEERYRDNDDERQTDERENEDTDDDDEYSRTVVRVRDGETDGHTQVSMDIDGNVGEGLRIREDSKLSFQGGKIIDESEEESD